MTIRQTELGDGWEMPAVLDETLRRAHEGWLADVWLLMAEWHSPGGLTGLAHLSLIGEDTKGRVVIYDGDTYRREDRGALQHDVVANCTRGVYGRTVWESIDQGPVPTPGPLEIRIKLDTSDHTEPGYELYALEGTDRDGLTVPVRLRTFAPGVDETMPNDATVDVPTGIRADDVLVWLAAAAYRDARALPVG